MFLQLICLTDLEQDFINPYDLSNKLNRFVVAEYAAQFVLTAALLGTGKWFVGGLQLIVLVIMIHYYMKKQVYIDATDAFKQLKPQKTRRTVLFGVYCFTFVFITYRLAGLHNALPSP